MAVCYCGAPGTDGAHQGLVVSRIRQAIARNRTLPAPQVGGALRARYEITLHFRSIEDWLRSFGITPTDSQPSGRGFRGRTSHRS